MKAQNPVWIGGTVLLALALAAGAWLLLYSPLLDTVDEARADRDATEERNDLLRVQVAALAAEFERLDERRAELAALRTQFPTEVELPELTRGLAAMAEATGATVTSVSVGTAQLLGDPPELPPAPDGTEAPVLPAPPAGLHAVPISLTVEGTFEQAQEYASALQGEQQRLFLLSHLTWTSADEEGRERFSIGGHTYVLAPDTDDTDEG